MLNPSMFSNRVDQLLVSFLARADSPTFPLSLDCSFDRVLASAAVFSGGNVDEDRIINCARNLGSLLIESADRCYRKRVTVRNAVSWPLSHDLTTRVFAMLDTPSVVRAAATCSMFHKCAMDPFCYSQIDLTSHARKVNNAVLSTMIQRAGSAIRSLKIGFVEGSSGPYQSHLGCLPGNHEADFPILTRSCLNPLWTENGAVGNLLRSLHIYNIKSMDPTSLCCAISACRNLIDLKIVGYYAGLQQVLGIVTRYCHLIVHLFFEVWIIDGIFDASVCEDLVVNCIDLSSLALRGFDLADSEAQILLEGFSKLKCLDLSASFVTGSFLRNLGDRRRESVLETLILQKCSKLLKEEVVGFLTSLLQGDFKFIRHFDVSNCYGLETYDGWGWILPGFPLEKLKEERPEIRIVAEFPPRVGFLNYDCALGIVATTTSRSSYASSSSSSSMESGYDEEDSSASDWVSVLVGD